MPSKKSCSKQNTAKFKRRKSPPYNSSDCKDRKMKGKLIHKIELEHYKLIKGKLKRNS